MSDSKLHQRILGLLVNDFFNFHMMNYWLFILDKPKILIKLSEAQGMLTEEEKIQTVRTDNGITSRKKNPQKKTDPATPKKSIR